MLRKSLASTVLGKIALASCNKSSGLSVAPGNSVTANDLLLEAQAIFPNTLLAKDFLTLDVSPSE